MEQEELKIDPQKLRAEAQREPSRRGLADFAEAIRVLKEDKGFSFREIAAWLQQRGLSADHNAVWRAYSKAVSGATAPQLYERNERSEQKGTHEGAMPWIESA